MTSNLVLKYIESRSQIIDKINIPQNEMTLLYNKLITKDSIDKFDLLFNMKYVYDSSYRTFQFLSGEDLGYIRLMLNYLIYNGVVNISEIQFILNQIPSLAQVESNYKEITIDGSIRKEKVITGEDVFIDVIESLVMIRLGLLRGSYNKPTTDVKEVKLVDSFVNIEYGIDNRFIYKNKGNVNSELLRIDNDTKIYDIIRYNGRSSVLENDKVNGSYISNYLISNYEDNLPKFLQPTLSSLNSNNTTYTYIIEGITKTVLKENVLLFSSFYKILDEIYLKTQNSSTKFKNIVKNYNIFYKNIKKRTIYYK